MHNAITRHLARFIVRRAEEAEKRAAAAEAENRIMRQLLQGRAA